MEPRVVVVKKKIQSKEGRSRLSAGEEEEEEECCPKSRGRNREIAPSEILPSEGGDEGAGNGRTKKKRRSRISDLAGESTSSCDNSDEDEDNVAFLSHGCDDIPSFGDLAKAFRASQQEENEKKRFGGDKGPGSSGTGVVDKKRGGRRRKSKSSGGSVVEAKRRRKEEEEGVSAAISISDSDTFAGEEEEECIKEAGGGASGADGGNSIEGEREGGRESRGDKEKINSCARRGGEGRIPPTFCKLSLDNVVYTKRNSAKATTEDEGTLDMPLLDLEDVNGHNLPPSPPLSSASSASSPSPMATSMLERTTGCTM